MEYINSETLIKILPIILTTYISICIIGVFYGSISALAKFQLIEGEVLSQKLINSRRLGFKKYIKGIKYLDK